MILVLLCLFCFLSSGNSFLSWSEYNQLTSRVSSSYAWANRFLLGQAPYGYENPKQYSQDP